MRPALRLLLAAAVVAPANSNEDACAVILKEEGLDPRACAALRSRKVNCKGKPPKGGTASGRLRDWAWSRKP